MRIPRVLAACLVPAVLAVGFPSRPAAGAPAAHRSMVDGAGRPVTLTREPARIVSLAPSVTDMIRALGAGDRLVGVSDFCNIPPGDHHPARVGGLVNPDLERIVTLEPDLVLATTSGNYLEDADRITRLGIPVYTLDTPSVAEVLSSIRTLGGILGDERGAAELAAGLDRRLEAVADRLEGRRKPRVLFAVWGDPVLAPGGRTFLDDALARAGADSISSGSEASWAEIGLEQIVAAAPEIILTVPDNRSFVDALKADPRWRTVPAVTSGRVYIVSDAIQRPGPGIVDGIEEVAALLHPTGTSGAPR